MQNQSSAQPATANLEVVMVAQRLGGSTSTALAVPADVPIGTMGGDNSAEEFDLSLSPPGKAEAKKVEPETKRPRVPPRMQTKRAASEEPRQLGRASIATRRAVANSLWPDSQAAAHPKVQLGDSGWTILKLVEQMDADRRHTKLLKDTIETMHVSQLQQMADLLAITKDVTARDLEHS